MPVFWFVLKVVFSSSFSSGCAARCPASSYNQLMDFGWKFLMPLATVNIICTSLWLALK